MMKRARFAEVQIVGALQEAEARAKTPDLARRNRISEATIQRLSIGAQL